MKYVYLLRSKKNPRKTYVGISVDVNKRLQEHNYKQSQHTAKHAPWELVACVAFSSASSADRFEEYLKTGSGRAFAKRHFW